LAKYEIKKLKTQFWVSQSPNLVGNFPNDFIKEYREVGELKFRILQQIRQINLILCRRESYINQYRGIEDQLRNNIFKKSLTKEEEKKIEKEKIKLYELISIDTEIYFIYAKLLLDKLVGIVKHYDSSFLVGNNFTELWDEINKNGYSDKKLDDYIQNNAKWFQLMIRVPRNIIFVHDFQTTGSGGGDHGIDFGITKSTEKRSAQKSTDKLRLMKKSHLVDLPELASQNNPFQIIRIFDHNSEKLSLEEIKKLEQMHMQIGGMFPYIIEVNKKLQELLDFFADWIKQKVLNSILNPHIP